MEDCSVPLSESPTQIAAPVPEPTACPRCGVIASHRITPGAGVHPWRMTCTDCSAFIKWYSTRSKEERAAQHAYHRNAALLAAPPTPLQLSFLSALGGSVSAVNSRLSASLMIDFLKGRGIA